MGVRTTAVNNGYSGKRTNEQGRGKKIRRVLEKMIKTHCGNRTVLSYKVIRLKPAHLNKKGADCQRKHEQRTEARAQCLRDEKRQDSRGKEEVKR